MNGPRSINVHYELIPTTCYSLSSSVDGGSGGTPTASSSNCSGGQYTSGTVVSLTASPSSGWRVAHWHGTNSNSSTSTSNSVTMNGPRSIIVHYDRSFGQAGDVDCNGVVTSIDAALILQKVVGFVNALPCEEAADVNGDGFITSIDALLTLQYVAGFLHTLPAGAPAEIRRLPGYSLRPRLGAEALRGWRSGSRFLA